MDLRTRLLSFIEMSFPSYYTSSLSPRSLSRELICRACHLPVSNMDSFLSRKFSGAKGKRAGLFDDVSNVKLGERDVWLMTTGVHTVRTCSCLGCGAYLGWKIVRAHDGSEAWKNGAFVLERDSILVHSVYEECQWDSDSTPTSSPKLKLKAIPDLRPTHGHSHSHSHLHSHGHSHSLGLSSRGNALVPIRA